MKKRYFKKKIIAPVVAVGMLLSTTTPIFANTDSTYFYATKTGTTTIEIDDSVLDNYKNLDTKLELNAEDNSQNPEKSDEDSKSENTETKSKPSHNFNIYTMLALLASLIAGIIISVINSLLNKRKAKKKDKDNKDK